MRVLLAFKAFFRVLFSATAAERVGAALEDGAPEAAAPQAKVEEAKPARTAAAPARPARSDALTLLAALQREARLIDIVKEPLVGYSDQQIGAAARDVLRNCGKVLDRFFALEPVLSEPDGATVEAPAGFDAERLRLVGNVVGEPPHRGQLVHHGWQAGKCELPQWTGAKSAERIVAAAEIEVK
jgi:hypothetical protein